MNKNIMKKIPAFLQKRMPAPMVSRATKQKAKEINNGIKLNLENLLICADYCGTCPSYPGVKGEALYCATGKSASIINEAGCNCMTCPLFEQCGKNSHGYFCRDGAPKAAETLNGIQKIKSAKSKKPVSEDIDYLKRFTTNLVDSNPGPNTNDTGFTDNEIIIHFASEKNVTANAVQSILEAALEAGIPHTHVCGGRGKCSTCRVLVLDGKDHLYPRNKIEAAMAAQKGFSDEVRLACQAHAKGNIKIKRLVYDESDIDDAIHKSSLPVQIAGTEIQAAILFSDIRSFTSFSENNMPYDIVHILNRYFNVIGKHIDTEGGFIDKYMGDGIMVIFGLDPDTYGHPAEQALRAAEKMLVSLNEFNDYLSQHFDNKFDIGIGIHYGPVVVGNIGFHKKMEFTAIGDTVNLASRIESLNKRIKSRVLVSNEAYMAVKDSFEWSQSYRTMVKGKAAEIKVHRPSFG